MNKSDFSLISGYLKNGSPIYTEQEKYVLRDITERLDSYELTDVSYADANNCVISTRETYYVQVKGKPLQLMTQECKYNVENQGDKWQLTSFADMHFLLYKKPPAAKFNETYYFLKLNSVARSSDIFAIVPGSKILFSPAIVSAS